MAVYKTIYCYPFSENANLASVFPYYNTMNEKVDGEPFYFSCRVDTSNKNVVGYSIKIYDDGGNVVFPVGGAEPRISPVDELPSFADDPSINTGVNGTYLKIPFFQEYDQVGETGYPSKGSFNALYCNETAFYTDYFMADLILGAGFPTSVTGEMEPTVGWDNCWLGWNGGSWSGPLNPVTIGGRSWDGKINGVTVTSDHVIVACVLSNVTQQNEWHLFRLNAAGTGLEMISDPAPADTGVASWVANKPYHSGDVVYYSSHLYKANTDITSSVDPSHSSAWDEISWPSLTHACLIRYGTHAGMYSLPPASPDGEADRLQGFWFPATGGDPISQFVMNGSSYSWEITLYQGPELSTVQDLKKDYDNSAAQLTKFPTLSYIDIAKMPGDWFDMSLGQGTIMGSNASRLQLSDLSETRLPGDGLEDTPILLNKFVSIGNIDVISKSQTEALGTWQIDSEKLEVLANAAITSVSMSLGHAYPQNEQLEEANVKDSDYALFYKYSSSEEGIYERDIVDIAVGTPIDLTVKQDYYKVGQRLLLMAQSNSTENGVYVYNGSELDGKYYTRAADCASWANYLGRIFYARNRRENYSNNAVAGGTLDATPLYFYPQEPIPLFPIENNDYFHKIDIKDLLYDRTGKISANKDYYIGSSFQQNNFQSLSRYGMPPVTASSGNYIVVGAQQIVAPKKGDMIALKPNGTTEKFFRVLKTEGSIATVMAFEEASVPYFSTTDNSYEGSIVDLYLNQAWPTGFTDDFKAAMVPSTIGQDSWYADDVSGNPIYLGIDNQGTLYNWSLAEEVVNGHTFDRYVYEPSLSDIIDYLGVAPRVIASSTTKLTAENLREMFLGTSSKTILLRSKVANGTTDVLDVWPTRWHVGHNTCSYSYNRCVRPVFRLDISKVEYRLMPALGDIVEANLDSQIRKYKVINVSDDLTTTTLLGLFDLGESAYDSSASPFQLYRSSALKAALDSWRSTFTAQASNAAVDRTIQQSFWRDVSEAPSSGSYVAIQLSTDIIRYLTRGGTDTLSDPTAVSPLSLDMLFTAFGLQETAGAPSRIIGAEEIAELVSDNEPHSTYELSPFWLIDGENNSQRTDSYFIDGTGNILLDAVTASKGVRPVVTMNLSLLGDYSIVERIAKGDTITLNLDSYDRDYLVLKTSGTKATLLTLSTLDYAPTTRASAILEEWQDSWNSLALNAITSVSYDREAWRIAAPGGFGSDMYYQEIPGFNGDYANPGSYQTIFDRGYASDPTVTVKSRLLTMRDLIEYYEANPWVPVTATNLNSDNFTKIARGREILLGDDFGHFSDTVSSSPMLTDRSITSGQSIINFAILAVIEVDLEKININPPSYVSRFVSRAMRYENGAWQNIVLPSNDLMSCYYKMPKGISWDGTEYSLGDAYGSKNMIRPYSFARLSADGSVLNFEDPTQEALLQYTFVPFRPFIGNCVCKILKNKATKTYISPNQNLSTGDILHLLGGKTIRTTSNTDLGALRVQAVDKKFWYIMHTNILASPYFISYKTDAGTPFKYELLTCCMTGSANAFTDYTTPFLTIEGVQNNSIETDSSAYHAIGAYYQGQAASWESYRFMLKDVDGNVLQDTGEKYDKEMRVWFLGLDSGAAYYVTLVVTDDIGYRVTYTVPMYTNEGENLLPYSDSLIGDANLLTATLECETHSVLLEYHGEDFPDYENGTISIYRREKGSFRRPSCTTGEDEYAEWFGEWHPVAINTEDKAIRDFNVAQGHYYQYAIFPKDLTHKKLYANQSSQAFLTSDREEFLTQDNRVFEARYEDGALGIFWDEWAIVELIPEDEKMLLEDEVVQVPSIKKKYRVDPKSVWLLKFSADVGSIDQNISRGDSQTLGQFDRVGYSPRNFASGSISCYLGSEIAPLSRGGYVERTRASIAAPSSTNQAAQMINLWKAFAHSSKPKLLTDRKGQKWIVQISSTNITPQEPYIGIPSKINFSWKQIAECDENVILYGDGDELSSFGSKPEWRSIFDYGRR